MPSVDHVIMIKSNDLSQGTFGIDRLTDIKIK